MIAGRSRTLPCLCSDLGEQVEKQINKTPTAILFTIAEKNGVIFLYGIFVILLTMQDAILKESIRKSLAMELPGESAQLRMAPDHRRPLDFYTNELPKASIAAVMLLLFRSPADGELSTLLIKRPETGIHASQIALPGGRVEPEDPDLIATALRETREEISVDPSEIDVLGKLSPVYIPPSRFLVTPVVGWYSGHFNFIRAENEVSDLFIIPIKSFIDRELRFVAEFRMHTGQLTQAPAYKLGNESMWGATAMMFSEFSEVIKDLI
jgi:8-oxo-dGTP pyrophosphatase MutT (NUDIX family)